MLFENLKFYMLVQFFYSTFDKNGDFGEGHLDFIAC